MLTNMIHSQTSHLEISKNRSVCFQKVEYRISFQKHYSKKNIQKRIVKLNKLTRSMTYRSRQKNYFEWLKLKTAGFQCSVMNGMLLPLRDPSNSSFKEICMEYCEIYAIILLSPNIGGVRKFVLFF